MSSKPTALISIALGHKPLYFKEFFTELKTENSANNGKNCELLRKLLSQSNQDMKNAKQITLCRD